MKLKKLKLSIPSEMQECAAYWKWAQTMPMVKQYLYKIVNEGKRSIYAGKQLKDIGMRAGLPDYHLPVPTSKYHGFWLEMKTRNKNGDSIPEHQMEWIYKLNLLNHYATIAYGWEDAVDKTLNYLHGKV